MSIKSVLNEEIVSEVKELSGLIPGTEEHRIATDSITKLYDRAIELEKLEQAREKEENDISIREQQQADNKCDANVRNAIAIAGIAVPALLTVWGTFKTFKFEETGTVTTMFGRNFINKLFCLKK